MASAASLLLPKTAPAGPESQSVYRVIYVVATHPQGWEEATAVCVTEVAKTITDLRIARVAEKDVAVYPDGTHCFRVKLAVSYRVDRRRLLPGGQVTTVRRYLVLANQRCVEPGNPSATGHIQHIAMTQ